MKVDFSGFKRVVDALGGVEICLPQRVDDKDSKLHLSAGRHIVKGDTALAYVRNRHGLGDGSDLGRIKRQQKFLGAVVKKADQRRHADQPVAPLRLLDAATKSVTTDKDFTVDEMQKVAAGSRACPRARCSSSPCRAEAYTPDPNRIAWRSRTRTTCSPRSATTTRSRPRPQGTRRRRSPPAQVRVRVLNGTTIPGLAQRAADQLTARGYPRPGSATVAPRSPPRPSRGTARAPTSRPRLAQVVPGSKPARDPFATAARRRPGARTRLAGRQGRGSDGAPEEPRRGQRLRRRVQGESEADGRTLPDSLSRRSVSLLRSRARAVTARPSGYRRSGAPPAWASPPSPLTDP